MREVLKIDTIKVGQRHRHDLGDIESLAASIKAVGLLHPPVVTPDRKLIAGKRRLAACKHLGWESVPVTVADLDHIVRGEFAENAHRKDFLPSEIASIMRELEPVEKAAAVERMTLGKVSPGSEPGRARDKVAAYAGISGRTLDKIKTVVEAAEKDPERFGPLVEAMDRTGKIDRYHGELRRAQAEETDAAPFSGPVNAKVIVGDYRVEGHVVDDNSVDLIFTDPPYDRETLPQYADLAKFAARVLVPGGSLVAYVGHYGLPDVLPLMTPHLRFWWQLALIHTGGTAKLLGTGVYVTWKPLLWFIKGQRRAKNVFRDSVKCEPGNKILDHEWAQGTAGPNYYIEQLSRKNALIVDPYLGGGTTGVCALQLGRRFVGFEINADTARKAEDRISRVGNGEPPKADATEPVGHPLDIPGFLRRAPQ
jgi:hypothetical protein